MKLSLPTTSVGRGFFDPFSCSFGSLQRLGYKVLVSISCKLGYLNLHILFQNDFYWDSSKQVTNIISALPTFYWNPCRVSILIITFPILVDVSCLSLPIFNLPFVKGNGRLKDLNSIEKSVTQSYWYLGEHSLTHLPMIWEHPPSRYKIFIFSSTFWFHGFGLSITLEFINKKLCTNHLTCVSQRSMPKKSFGKTNNWIV
jgi:hypothetical protein